MNTIIATGTGSGKSFCFGIPIISECLRLKDRGVKGVKAIIVYPMNALANSQYDDFSVRLAGSGLKIALYTGDTKNSRKEALTGGYLSLTGRKEPYDSELISREEIKETPPDILLTNYVMLEYILTRSHDKEIFPEANLGVLKFLVLDEVHTYTGRRGADVAYLIRRLKQHTRTTGELLCIGTSATVQSTEGEDASVAISDFATKLFGEEFEPGSVITEAYDEPLHQGNGVLPDKVLVTDDMLSSFDNSQENIRTLVVALLGSKIPDDATLRTMGDLLGSQRTVQFIEKVLFKNSMSLADLVDAYRVEVRSASSDEECWRELRAAFLAGMKAEIDVHGQNQKRIIPKIHSFFSQGREIKSCITPDAPHLSDAGEVTCPECTKKKKNRIRKTFPLIFADDGTLRPRDIDDIDVEGKSAYIFLGRHDPEKTPPPDQWLTKTGKVQGKYQEYADLERADYCPECNKIYMSGRTEPCLCPSKMKVTVVPYPFFFCPFWRMRCVLRPQAQGSSTSSSPLAQWADPRRLMSSYPIP